VNSAEYHESLFRHRGHSFSFLHRSNALLLAKPCDVQLLATRCCLARGSATCTPSSSDTASSSSDFQLAFLHLSFSSSSRLNTHIQPNRHARKPRDGGRPARPGRWRAARCIRPVIAIHDFAAPDESAHDTSVSLDLNTGDRSPRTQLIRSHRNTPAQLAFRTPPLQSPPGQISSSASLRNFER
jgi:hypothetical protein